MNENLLYNLNIERAILSAILFEPESLTDIASKLAPKHLYLPFHRALFITMIELDKKALPIDDEFIKTVMVKNNSYDEIAYLDVMTANALSAPDAYIEDTIERWKKREIIKLSHTIQKVLVEEHKDSEDAKLTISNKIKELDSESNSEGGGASELMDEMEAYMNDMSAVEFITTAIKNLNGLFGGGFEHQEVVIVGARPSVGKTSWITTLIGHLVNAGVGVLFDSLEMPKLPISRRILSAMSSNPLSDLKRKKIKNLTAYREAFFKIKNSDLVVHDKRGDGAFLKAKARRTLRQNPNIKVWIIDHLGELKYDKSQQLRLEIGDFMSDMRDIAKEFNVVVIALSQLRRDAVNRKPTLADLRESGEIEQKADKVIFLHRDDYYADDKNEKPEFLPTKFIVAKNRDGRVGEVEAYLEGKYTRFSDKDYGVTVENIKQDNKSFDASALLEI